MRDILGVSGDRMKRVLAWLVEQGVVMERTDDLDCRRPITTYRRVPSMDLSPSGNTSGAAGARWSEPLPPAPVAAPPMPPPAPDPDEHPKARVSATAQPINGHLARTFAPSTKLIVRIIVARSACFGSLRAPPDTTKKNEPGGT